MVASPDLDLGDLINDISDRLQVVAATIRQPVQDVELDHLVCLFTLQGEVRNLETCCM